MSTDKQKKRSLALRCGAMVGARPATLTQNVRGQFIRWKQGMRVMARKIDTDSYIIERPKWKQPLVDCMNCLCGVPGAALSFGGKRPNVEMTDANSKTTKL